MFKFVTGFIIGCTLTHIGWIKIIDGTSFAVHHIIQLIN